MAAHEWGPHVFIFVFQVRRDTQGDLWKKHLLHFKTIILRKPCANMMLSCSPSTSHTAFTDQRVYWPLPLLTTGFTRPWPLKHPTHCNQQVACMASSQTPDIRGERSEVTKSGQIHGGQSLCCHWKCAGIYSSVTSEMSTTTTSTQQSNCVCVIMKWTGESLP